MPPRASAVSEVTTADALAVLTPIWHDKPETARPVGLDPLRQRVRAVALHWKLAAGVALVSGRTAVSQDLVRDCDRAMRSRDAQATQPAGDTATRSLQMCIASRGHQP